MRGLNTVIVIVCLLSTGCVIPPISHVPPLIDASTATPPEGPKKLVVFYDGTNNAEDSYTNVARLYNLVTLQNNPTINTLYVEGVGTGGRIFGLTSGWGIGLDVRLAYRWLGENFDAARGDSLFVFGFSRGAYAARILAALVHIAGIPDLSEVSSRSRGPFVKRIYNAYKTTKTIEGRQRDVAAVLGAAPVSVPLVFLGLWDTVEALGAPDYTEEDFGTPNPWYADQLCNIRKAAHAMSIDDDRARIFTPILLTRHHLIAQCNPPVDIDSVVEEVWFSGAHADVGGQKGTDLDGVSLNWMLDQIAPYGLVPPNTRIYANRFDRSNDPEAGIAGAIYRKRNRNLTAYTTDTSTRPYNHGRLKVHRAVIDRLENVPVAGWESRWFESLKFRECFYRVATVLRFRGGDGCPVDIVR